MFAEQKETDDMSHKALVAGLVLAVLPALAVAQTNTSTAAPTTTASAAPQQGAVNPKVFAERGSPLPYYRPPVAGQPNTAAALASIPAVPATQPAAVAAANASALRVGAVPAVAPIAAVPVAAAVPQAVAAPVTLVAVSPAPAPQPAVAGSNTDSEPTGMVLADYRQGLLTLVADRTTLKKALDMVASKTGATIDLAPELASELIAAKLGPATPNEVVAALLDSPKFDYIILGSGTPGGIQKVLVRRRQGFGRQPVTVATAPQPAATDAGQEQSPTSTTSEETAPAQQDGPPPAK